jgi:hypothetical protein
MMVATVGAGTDVCSRSPRSGPHDGGAGGEFVSPTMTANGGRRCGRRLHLALHAAVVEGAVGRRRPPQLGGERQRLVAAGGVDHEHVAAAIGRRTRPRRRTPAACGRRRARSRCRAWPGRRVLDQAVVAPPPPTAFWAESSVPPWNSKVVRGSSRARGRAWARSHERRCRAPAARPARPRSARPPRRQ